MTQTEARAILERIRIAPPFDSWGVSFYFAEYPDQGVPGVVIEILNAPDRDTGVPKRLQYDAPIRTPLAALSENMLMRIAWHAWCSYVEHEGAESFATANGRVFDPHGDSVEAKWFENRRQVTAIQLGDLEP